MVRIFVPSQEEVEQSLKFRTYVNYLDTLGDFLAQQYGRADRLVSLVAQEEAFRRITKNSDADLGAVKRILRNAWLTELQIRIAASAKEFIPYSNHWAPVQLYYSLYLGLRAWFLAAGRVVSNQHAATLRCVAQEIKRHPELFPYPWKLLCEGDPEGGTATYAHLPSGVVVAPVSSLKEDADFWGSFAMFLRTTRARQIDRAVEAWKIQSRRRRIRATERQRLTARFDPTSLFDVVYRLRIRSNYADADTFLLSLENQADSDRFHRAMRAVNWCSLLLLELHVARRVGKDNFAKWVESFARDVKEEHSNKTVGHRWKIIGKVL